MVVGVGENARTGILTGSSFFKEKRGCPVIICYNFKRKRFYHSNDNSKILKESDFIILMTILRFSHFTLNFQNWMSFIFDTQTVENAITQKPHTCAGVKGGRPGVQNIFAYMSERWKRAILTYILKNISRSM